MNLLNVFSQIQRVNMFFSSFQPTPHTIIIWRINVNKSEDITNDYLCVTFIISHYRLLPGKKTCLTLQYGHESVLGYEMTCH